MPNIPIISGITASIGRLTSLFYTLEGIQKQQAEELKELRKENAEMRKELSRLIERVGVVEEGRKTMAAEVKTALVETLAKWEVQRAQEQAETAKREAGEAKEQAERLRRQVEGK